MSVNCIGDILSSSALSASLSYVGCFVDTSTRDVAHNEWSDAHMTIELCAHHCQGYRYMAVQVNMVDCMAQVWQHCEADLKIIKSYLDKLKM